jgi:hypothetical protein
MQSSGSLARFLGPLAAGFLLAAEKGNASYASWPLLTAGGILVLSALVVFRLGKLQRASGVR